MAALVPSLAPLWRPLAADRPAEQQGGLQPSPGGVCGCCPAWNIGSVWMRLRHDSRSSRQQVVLFRPSLHAMQQESSVCLAHSTTLAAAAQRLTAGSDSSA